MGVGLLSGTDSRQRTPLKVVVHCLLVKVEVWRKSFIPEHFITQLEKENGENTLVFAPASGASILHFSTVGGLPNNYSICWYSTTCLFAVERAVASVLSM